MFVSSESSDVLWRLGDSFTMRCMRRCGKVCGHSAVPEHCPALIWFFMIFPKVGLLSLILIWPRLANSSQRHLPISARRRVPPTPKPERVTAETWRCHKYHNRYMSFYETSNFTIIQPSCPVSSGGGPVRKSFGAKAQDLTGCSTGHHDATASELPQNMGIWTDWIKNLNPRDNRWYCVIGTFWDK